MAACRHWVSTSCEKPVRRTPSGPLGEPGLTCVPSTHTPLNSASTIVLAVRRSLSIFLDDPPERRRDDFAAVLGRAREYADYDCG